VIFFQLKQVQLLEISVEIQSQLAEAEFADRFHLSEPRGALLRSKVAGPRLQLLLISVRKWWGMWKIGSGLCGPR